MLLQNNDWFLSMCIVFYPVIFSRMWIVFDPLDICWFCFFVVSYCVSVYYMYRPSECSCQDPPYEPASWHLLSWLTFWLSICNTWLPLPRGSKIKGLLSIRHECLTGFVLTCPASVVTFSRDIVICRSIIHLFCSGQCRIGVVSHGNNSSSGHDWPAGAVGAA